MRAPLAKPAVFLRKGAASADDILGGLKGVGVRWAPAVGAIARSLAGRAQVEPEP